ncbi:MAG TPA: hypothetical protein VIZ22_10780 [Candidatus Limnocylindrales bacterium]
MNRTRTVRRLGGAVTVAALFSLLAAGTSLAHEVRDVGEYTVVVGFIDEPVFVGQKSGLEFFVDKGDTPVDGLEQTLKAEVIYQDQHRDLPIEARFGEEGAYESVFFPTAAGPYTFHISGTLDGQAIDESFTSSPEGFSEVEDLASGQFPVQFPSQAEVVSDAQAGRAAQTQATIGIAVGVIGLVVAVVAVGLALSARRRAPAPK